MKTPSDKNRRRLLTVLAGSCIAGSALPERWPRPVIESIMLPAHGQTTCATDEVITGPIEGNEFGASNCQQACEAAAAQENAQLCSVETISTSSGDDCACSVDLP